MTDITITRRDFEILLGIYNSGKITPTQLSDKIKIPQTVISKNIQKFYDADMLSYDVPKKKRTQKLYYLTREGMNFLAGLKRIFEEC
jgi:DNA-binding MarR family transcriptional regulator